MTLDRRSVLQLAASAAIASVLPRRARGRTGLPYGAIAFDAFPVFDPRPIAALAETLYPGQGAALMEVWRTRLFEYQWLRALGRRHMDFLESARDSLAFAAAQLKLDLPAERQRQLMAAWSELKPWPDAPAALHALHSAGYRLAFLSNMTQTMLEAGLRNAGLQDLFEAVISTDRIRSFKPDPRAYQLGVDELQLDRSQILFAAFAGWDVAGARWFGYPTCWVNRQGSLPERLGADPDFAVPDLPALVEALRTREARIS